MREIFWRGTLNKTYPILHNQIHFFKDKRVTPLVFRIIYVVVSGNNVSLRVWISASCIEGQTLPPQYGIEHWEENEVR